MRILYVAKHNSGGNDDEGAISHALEQLGHEVIRVNEQQTRQSHQWPKANLCLFHKWADTGALLQIKCPKVFWWFDLVEWPLDSTLESRSQTRRDWMAHIIPHVDLGFMSDGDWVLKVNNYLQGDKLWRLTQGADERYVGRGYEQECKSKVLFTGMARRCGVARGSFLYMCQNRLGPLFCHVERGTHQGGLAHLVASHPIVLAPDTPVTDLYYSNRIYLTTGFGGFLLHPKSLGAAAEFQDRLEICYYKNLTDMFDLIDYYLARPQVARQIGTSALERVKREHLYRHRCEKLLTIVKEKLHV